MKLDHNQEQFIGIDTEEDTLFFYNGVVAGYAISLERLNERTGLYELVSKVGAGETYRIRLRNPRPIKQEDDNGNK